MSDPKAPIHEQAVITLRNLLGEACTYINHAVVPLVRADEQRRQELVQRMIATIESVKPPFMAPLARGEPTRHFQHLQRMIQMDPGYGWSWHCNLAVPIRDNLGCTRRHANETAAVLMRHLFSFDSTATPEWKSCEREWAKQDE